MPPDEVVIVLEPIGEGLEVANFPRNLNHLPADLSSLLYCVGGYGTCLRGHIRAESSSRMKAILKLEKGQR